MGKGAEAGEELLVRSQRAKESSLVGFHASLEAECRWMKAQRDKHITLQVWFCKHRSDSLQSEE